MPPYLQSGFSSGTIAFVFFYPSVFFLLLVCGLAQKQVIEMLLLGVCGGWAGGPGGPVGNGCAISQLQVGWHGCCYRHGRRLTPRLYTVATPAPAAALAAMTEHPNTKACCANNTNCIVR